MGFLGGLFDKKTCSICGGEIGLLGNRKLADGNLCKTCAGKLSPLFSERRESTVEQIREQLAYREANEARVAAFNVTKTLGNATKVLADEGIGAIVVTASGSWRQYNPDVVDLDQITNCEVEIRESKTEIRKKNEDGTTESYDPPRWDTDYNVYVTIYISSPYFDQIGFRVNDSAIERRGSVEYVEAVNCANEIRAFLTGQEFVPEELPKTPQVPPMPPASGRPSAADLHAAVMAANPAHTGSAAARPARVTGRPAPAADAPRFCPHCGKPVATPGAPFCSNCGGKLG